LLVGKVPVTTIIERVLRWRPRNRRNICADHGLVHRSGPVDQRGSDLAWIR
jgi:hypothetical protein